MQQILNFTIEIFDIRTKTSVKIKDDNELVRNISIRKNVTLDNTAVITFAKSRSYKMLDIEKQIKLYNYVKIDLTVKNYETGEGTKIQKFYFSGFLQSVSKQTSYGTTPSASVAITIADFANLFKTTFYTKNLTFVQILQEAVPEFRLINFEEIFNDPKNRLLNGFYSLNQMGFIFFSFFFFKFLYNIVYDKPGEEKTIDGKPIFKQFKIFMPFGFDLIKKDGSKIKSIFTNQVSSLIIYKQLQGVALDLYKYLYPAPIFDFLTHETEKSVILQIRPTPFMSFARPTVDSIKLSYGDKTGIAGDTHENDSYRQKDFSLEGAIEKVDSYKIIDQEDFGHQRIKEMYQETTASVSDQISTHLNPIMQLMNQTLQQSKKLDVGTFIPDNRENDELVSLYFNEIAFDIRFIETINFTRTAQNVVNVIWTTPTTDTAVLQSSGRSIIYGLLQEKLSSLGGSPNDQFKQYIANQFLRDQQPNPVFLWNYKNMYPNNYVSGDMNFFGFREFEIKWNCLTFYDSSVYHVLSYVDKQLLEKLRDENKGKRESEIASEAIKRNSQNIDKPVKNKKGRNIVKNETPMKKIGVFYQQAFDDPDFKKAAAQMGFDEAKLKELKAADISDFIMNAKNVGSGKLGEFVSKLNGIIAKSYRENEHLYDVQILKPIDVSILPGMIVDSVYPNKPDFNSPRFRGYVSDVTHTIDFTASTMKSNFIINRAASDDSALIISGKTF